MKQLSISRLLQLGSLMLLVWLPTGCLLTDHRPLSTCRLTSSTEKTGNTTIRQNWTYTADGQLASSSTQTSNGQNGPINSDEYTYNTEGLLINKLSREGTNLFRRLTYAYDQGRIISADEYRYDRDRNLSRQTYDYDTNGGLSRITYRFTGGALVYSYTYLFSNGKQTDYIYYDNSTGVESHPYRFENGLIAQEFYSTAPATIDYSYDTAGRLIRTDNNLSNSYYVYDSYEYTDGRPATAAIPPFKGWPAVTPNTTDLTLISLLTKKTSYRKDVTGTIFKAYETLYTYTKNEAGYPLTERKEFRTYDMAGQVIDQGILSEKSYTYDNCFQGD